VKSGAKIEISYMGYTTLVTKASQGMVVMLQEDAEVLEELVVTGYTSERKADITGSISVVKMADIEDVPTANVVTALQGRIPGVNISTNGSPGGVAYGVMVRGITTINDSSPLYVIDGVQTREHLSTILNPNDVESIQVLKDAASAAIYGTKASNGVIIITTKHGKKDRMQIEFSSQLSAQTVANRLEMLNAQEWGEVYWQASKNDGITPSHPVYGSGETPVIPDYIDSSFKQKAADSDWQSLGYQTSFMQNYNLTISSGTDRTTSFLGVNYVDDKGMLKYTEFKRFNIKVNNTWSFLNNRLRVGENMNLSRYTEHLAPGGIHELLLTQHPLIPVYTEDGNWGGYISSLSDMNNPMRLLEQAAQNESGNWRAFGNAFIELEPIKNLVFRSNGSIDYRNGFSKTFAPSWSEGDRTIYDNSLDVNNNYMYEWIWSNTATYNFSLGNHNFSLLAGIEAKEYRTEYLTGKRTDFLLQTEEFKYLNAGTGSQNNTHGATEYATYSQFGKLNYNYADRYLFSASVRRDASSRFGKDNAAAIFPAVSAGWRLGNEEFMQSFDWLDEFKIRASWGKNGNDLINNEASYSKFVVNNTAGAYDMAGTDNSVLAAVIKDRSANTSLRWEVTTQTNIGFDAEFFNNRLAISFDWYNKDTDDMLIDRPYIGVIGEGGTYAYNGASLNNQGVEGIITWRDTVGDFRYEISANASHYKNIITSLPDDIYYTWGGGNGVDKSIVGQPYGSWFGYVADGLFKTEGSLYNGIEQSGKGLGRIRYKDLSEDFIINDEDRDWLGSDHPRLTAGLNIALAYKQFDMSMFFMGMIRDAWNNSKYYTDFFQLWLGNHGKNLMNAWNPDENFDSEIPALTLQDLNNEGRASTYFIEDGSFLRLKNLQIGYTLPKEIGQKMMIQNARIYLQVQNLFTLTNYTGVDPEVLGYNYPIPRTFTLGMNVTF
ncbi:MAG: TonB-dependent receptor, partial [Tidjanibacter sp.]|nr:TonB-dependent receptor [Tidjanibacter sp.]